MNIYDWDINLWALFSVLYLVVSFCTFIPVLKAIFRRVELHPGGTSFDDSPHFSPESKLLLNQHYSRIMGTLVFWKNQAEKFKRFHYYCLYWTIPSSILIPIITQSISSDFYSKLLLTVISTHTALLLAFHRVFKVDRNYKSFRHGESEFYDTYRKLLDSPESFGVNEEVQLQTYFKEVDIIRKFVRNAETDNTPTIDECKPPATHN